jgi:glycosyltransferase involved in cell wall biosynthesis
MSRPENALARTRALGVVLPVHNEEDLLDAALNSLQDTFTLIRGWRIDHQLVIVLDSCTDTSAQIVEQWYHRRRGESNSPEVTVVTSESHNVGFARALGCATLLDTWHRLDPATIWIATTDADSRVPKEWLKAQVLQHELGVNLWCGRVSVSDWSSRLEGTSEQWQREYEEEADPIHGTSLGCNAEIYLASGGFRPIESSEDRDLCRRLQALGAVVHFDSSVPVVTSARRDARAPLGFAHALSEVEGQLGMTAFG